MTRDSKVKKRSKRKIMIRRKKSVGVRGNNENRFT